MARGKKSEFGDNWWAKKWNNSLSSFGYSDRLLRGKNYAREGNVLEVNINSGIIEAKVQGTRVKPYTIVIEVNALSNEEWDAVIQTMSCRAIFLAKLLSGEMPENIEEAFEESKVELFPKKASDITTSCSCPDYVKPCKHIAAVYYILGMEFDKDPFMIFKLRGKDKEQLLDELTRARCTENKEIEVKVKNDKKKEKPKKTLNELQKELREYKELSDKVSNMEFSYEPPQIKCSVLKRLGIPEFYNEVDNFEENMAQFYEKAEDEIRKLNT